MDDELLIAYFKGEVSDEETQRITEWIEAEIEHQRYYQQLCRLFEMSYWIEDMSEQTEVALPKKAKILPWKHYAISFMKVAAIFVLGFALHFFLNRQTTTTHHELQHQIHVPTGQHVEIMLADGSKVWLNSGSTLTFPSKFNGKKRLVELDGEGFFEVKSDKEHPFIVSAENVKVKVLGTKFNVKAYDDDDNIEVTLAEGKVGVGLDTKNLIQIMPGQQIKYMKASHRFIKREVRLQSYTSWICGKFYFTNYPLEKIAKQLERSFNVRIQILGNDLRNAAFTGDFVRGENIDQILRVMTANRLIKYEIEGDQITISKK